MAKTSQSGSGREMVTVYGKIPKSMVERLDELAQDRRWSRAQMVAYCIEQFIQGAGKGSK